MQMFRATCRDCGWVFDVVVLPLPITLAARACERTCCPMCANRVGNTVGAARTLSDDERSHKLRLEAQRAGKSGDVNLCPPLSTSTQEAST